MKKYFLTLIGVLACIFLISQNAMANLIAFESLPTTNSTHVSHHTTGGPVLADDFSTTTAGTIVGVEWWGAAPLSAGGTDSWEATFHVDDGAGAPFATPGFGGISQHLFTATGTDTDGDGIYHYVAAWSPADLFILANTTYWFSVANANGAGWTWANGAAPTIGSEQWDAVVSSGASGSPHFGPWSALGDTNFAFSIILAPEPGSLALIGLGLIAFVLSLRRYHDNA